MEDLKNCLDSSTIHGVANIARGRKYVRLFWSLVVICGFTGASFLIYKSFQSWAESPIKTTIETNSITEITFPKVTVCPPKDTYTDLNYDLMMAENMTLDNDTRQELANSAVEMLYDHLYEDMMRNIRKLEESDRFYNWYHGYSEIRLPFISYGRVIYRMYTAVSSGSVPTQYFGEEFDADKVETHLIYIVQVFPLSSVRNNPNVTLHLDVEKVSLEDLSSGYDGFSVDLIYLMETKRTYNYTPPTSSSYYITLSRDVLPADVKKQKLNVMPGYRVRWRYSGMEVEPETRFYNNTDYPSTMAFIRNCSKNITFSFEINLWTIHNIVRNTILE